MTTNYLLRVAIRQWVNCVTLGAAVAVCAGQSARPASTLAMPISVYEVKDVGIDEALKHLIAQMEWRIVVGFERVPAAAAPAPPEPKMTIHIDHATVGEVLKQICFGDSRYTFSDVEDGVINVYPVAEASEPAAILGLSLTQVDIKIREWPANLFGRVPELVPELGSYLSARATEYQSRTARSPRGSPGVIMMNKGEAPEIEIHLRNSSVRGLLNAIAAYMLTHVVTDESGNVHTVPRGWEFQFIVDPSAQTGLGGYPRWGSFPFP